MITIILHKFSKPQQEIFKTHMKLAIESLQHKICTLV